MTRTTQQLPKNITSIEAEKKARELVDLEATREQIEQSYKEKVAKLAADKAADLLVYEEPITKLTAELTRYAETNIGDWKGRSKTFPNGVTIGFRDGALSADFMEDVVPAEALAKLKETHPDFVRVKEDLDRHAIKKDGVLLGAEKLAALGIRLSRATRFYAEDSADN